MLKKGTTSDDADHNQDSHRKEGTESSMITLYRFYYCQLFYTTLQEV